MSTAEDRAPVVVEPIDPDADEATTLLAEYLAEIVATFGYDDSHGGPVRASELAPPTGCLLVVREDGSAVGIGGVRLLDPQTAEIKRMYLRSSMRGRGAGWSLLNALEAKAIELGASRGVLDTNATLTSALALYRAAGWQEIEKYNDNDQATHWFAKDLSG